MNPPPIELIKNVSYLYKEEGDDLPTLFLDSKKSSIFQALSDNEKSPIKK